VDKKNESCRDTQQIYNSVDKKNESLQGYSTIFSLSGREKRINARKLNNFLTFNAE